MPARAEPPDRAPARPTDRIRYAVEVRNSAATSDAHLDVLRDHDVALVDSDAGGAWPRFDIATCSSRDGEEAAAGHAGGSVARMDVTKLEHACLIVREGDAALVIDPGNHTRPVELDDAVAIVITHQHPDHVTAEQLRRILAANPGIPVMGPAGVAEVLADELPDLTVDVVADGSSRTVGPFALTFHGTTHAVIHASVPLVDNTGVMVNGTLFYPGDAYTDPGVPVDTLATPVGAPWLRIGDVMDYVAAIAPRRTFPVHERTLSGAGLDQGAMRIRSVTEPAGAAIVLEPGETLRL